MSEKIATYAAFGLFALAIDSITLAQTALFKHTGSNDPVAEDWEIDAPGPGVVTGPTSDAGTDAWFVDDNSTGSGATLLYVRRPSAAQSAAANSFGWNLTLNLRVVDVPDSTPYGSPSVVYLNGARYFGIYFATQADGDPVVHLPTQFADPPTFGPNFALEGGGGGYHIYQLSYDPSQGSADLFIDGIEHISNYVGFSLPITASFSWGCGGFDAGQGNFNLVAFGIVPEPSTLFVLVSAAGVLFAGRPRNSIRLSHI